MLSSVQNIKKKFPGIKTILTFIMYMGEGGLICVCVCVCVCVQKIFKIMNILKEWIFQVSNRHHSAPKKTYEVKKDACESPTANIIFSLRTNIQNRAWTQMIPLYIRKWFVSWLFLYVNVYIYIYIYIYIKWKKVWI